MARGSSFEGDRAASVAAMIMCDLQMKCSTTMMFTGAKCRLLRARVCLKACDLFIEGPVSGKKQ